MHHAELLVSTNWRIAASTQQAAISSERQLMGLLNLDSWLSGTAKTTPPASKERGPKALKCIKGEEKGRGEEGKEGNKQKDEHCSGVI